MAMELNNSKVFTYRL